MLDWAALMEPVALALLGDPARRPASGEWRYRRKGSLAVNVGGPRRGTWRDHEANVGGGVLELLAHVEGLEREDALEWLRDRRLLDGGGVGHGRRGTRLAHPAGSGARNRGPRVSAHGADSENRSTGRTGPDFSPAVGSGHGFGQKVAQTAWSRATPIPADPEHPARRWLARRHLWRPEIDLPPSIRWRPSERGPSVGAIVAAFARPGPCRLSGVQLVHVDAARAGVQRCRRAGRIRHAGRLDGRQAEGRQL